MQVLQQTVILKRMVLLIFCLHQKILKRQKLIEKSLAPYEVAAIYPMDLDRSLDMVASKPTLSIDWSDLQ